LAFQSLSRVHAVIEVSRDGSVVIYDDHSMNGTYRNNKKLKPGVR
jgi:pSer/pThr/pTyr-binding forkhead associated (FHA) protein